MDAHNVIDIPLEDLARDSILPPRIVDDERLEALCRSLAETGMAEPLVVRRAPDVSENGPLYLIILGYRRYLGAGRLEWDSVPGIVRDDLDDQGVLELAFDADKTTESRTPLEDCWYYASMCAAGMTQAALAEREGFSEGKASMYVRAGSAITPDRIAEAGLVPEDLAGFGITKLVTVAAGPVGEVPARIAAAVQPSSTEEDRQPSFEWQQGKKGYARATFRVPEVTAWSREERIEFIERVGPLLAQARSVEKLEDSSVAEVRSWLEEAHRVALLEAREDRTEQVLRLMELNTKLLLIVNHSPGSQPEMGRKPPGKRNWLLAFIRAPFQRARYWLRLGSMSEPGASMIEGSRRDNNPQIPIRFGAEEAA